MTNLPKSPDQTLTTLLNPDLKDFEYTYADEDNIQHTDKINALELKRLPKYLADHVAQKLAEYLVYKHGIKTNYEDEKKEILKEIYK